MNLRSVLLKFSYLKNTHIGKILKKVASTSLLSKVIKSIRYQKNLDDESYIKMCYKEHFGVEPDLVNPKNFNEKNNWRKLNDRKDLYTLMVDKFKMKEYVEEKCGRGHTFNLLGAWEKPEDIDFESLPEQFVLKVNHAGGIVACKDKSQFDKEEAIKELNKTLADDYFIRSREWPYKNVKRMVLAEEYMGENLVDYKNYCFNGRLHYTFVWNNHSREDGLKPEACFCGAYDTSWTKTTLDIDYPHDDLDIEKPSCYEEMKIIAEKLSKDIPFVRIDCYIVDGHVYVGEMTFFPWGGFLKFKDEEWNNRLGELEKLPEIDY